ncbi:MAG TPA: DUF5335 family protein [Anaeromyxobacteraceae bacterium]|nr:DUF5335 family protein [Anaeromyxobacteraceae bacterium]
MTTVREIAPSSWSGHLESLDRQVNERPILVVVAIDLTLDRENVRDVRVARNARLTGVDLERAGSDAGVIDLQLQVAGGELCHRVLRPVRLRAHERDDGELESLEIFDASGAKHTIFTEAHPRYSKLAAEVPWWEQPLPLPP